MESGELPSRAVERADSAQSFASSMTGSRKDSGGSEGAARRGDEVAIVVSSRKDSLTSAVRLVLVENKKRKNNQRFKSFIVF